MGCVVKSVSDRPVGATFVEGTGKIEIGDLIDVREQRSRQ